MNGCTLLGERFPNVKPASVKQAQSMIGTRVEYLRSSDIDKSGRGYFFPRVGTVTGAAGRNIDVSGDWVAFADLVEMRVIPEAGDEYDVWSDHHGHLKVELGRKTFVQDGDGPYGYPVHEQRVQAHNKTDALAVYRAGIRAEKAKDTQ